MPTPPPDKSPRLNPRIIGMLLLFTLIISASVIATDIFSKRDRTPAPAATSPTTIP